MGTLPKSLTIVSLPFEISTSFKKGTVHAPDAIIDELERLDTFEFLFGKDPFRSVPKTIIQPHDKLIVDARIQQNITRLLIEDVLKEHSFPISLGGEHTVSLGPIAAAAKGGPLGVVQMDAHSDLRDSYEDNPLSHACVMRRVHDIGCPTLGLGIRSMCSDENEYIKKNSIDIVSAKSFIDSRNWYAKLDKLPHRIYLTIDMDFFDPADVPAVGTPEPGGPNWFETLVFLQHLFASKEVVGADIVELMPTKGADASIRMAVRLMGILVGLKFPQ